MKKTVTVLLLALLFIACKKENKTQVDETTEAPETEIAPEKSDEYSALSDSPRHHEWVEFTRENGSKLKAFVVYPENDEPGKSVIVIHENRGLNDWARLFADQLAAEGFLVIAPDLISNTVNGIERTTDFENSDKAREAIYALDPNMVTSDLDMCYKYIKNDKASTGNVSVVGFCWGGSQTFSYATNNKEIDAGYVFYGTAPDDKSVLKTIEAPLYGFYGGNDNRVNSTIPDTEKAMKEFGKIFDYKIYEGAGHAFMRSGHNAEAGDPNKKAHDEAWERLLNLLKD